MESDIREPLLESHSPPPEKGTKEDHDQEEEEKYLDESLRKTPTTDYAKAGLFGKATMNWMNPTLKKGARKPLGKDDVPLLMKEHRTTRLYEVFNSNWPKEKGPHCVRRTLITTFRREFFWSCFSLCVIRLSVQFVSPLLIQSFLRVTTKGESFPYEGYVLVLILFVAKTTDTVCNHSYQFNCQKLGIQVRSVLISAVYRKGLRLSGFARQAHGAGQIVTYMSSDVLQISNVIVQLNNMWLVPGQVIIGALLLFSVTGISTFAGLAVLLIMAAATFVTGSQLSKFQRKVMRGRDARQRVTLETLNNMKIVKLQAWDKEFIARVIKARESEYSALTDYIYRFAYNNCSTWVSPLASTVAIFACFAILGGTMTASIAYTTIATVRIIQEPFRLFPNAITAFAQSHISLERLDRFLWSEELDVRAISHLPLGGSDLAISVDRATFKWVAELEAPALMNIDLRVKPGSLVAVVGKVGTGKSSLLAALLGEMSKVTGTVEIGGRTAYVPQQAWIQSGTIQDNVLFGQPMDKDRYQSALESCSLKTDLAQMEFGDQTEIGERGLNLSGGQKQRIQLARALYQDCDVYLLDDIFSAVDAHTASDLFKDCIVGALANKTVVLVTHQIDFLRGADMILVMKGGHIVQSGHYDDLLTGGTEFESLVDASNDAFSKVTPQEQQTQSPDVGFNIDSPSVGLRKPSSQTFQGFTSESFENLLSPPVQQVDEEASSVGNEANASVTGENAIRNSDPATTPTSLLKESSLERNSKLSSYDVGHNGEYKSSHLVQAEEREIGRVSWKVYWTYFTTLYKGQAFVILLLLQLLAQVFQIGGDYWVAYGTANNAEDHLDHHQSDRFVLVYAVVAFCAGVLAFLRVFLGFSIGLRTSQVHYLEMLHSLFRAPMSFFDTTPTGRILSRSSTDQLVLDIQVTMRFPGVFFFSFQVLGVLFVTLQVTWEVGILLIPLAIMYYKYQIYYFSTATELTRVDAITKAPLIHHFSETMAGFMTVRSFQQQERFIQMNVDRIDSLVRIDFHIKAANEWVRLRMEMMGVIVLCASSILLVSLPPWIVDPELVGLCLMYGMNLSGSLSVLAWLSCQLENSMVSVERIAQYTRLPQEAELTIEKTRPPSSWPQSGNIELQNLKLRYRPQTPLVLKGITLNVQGGEKVGVVGRTGSGKSTLILALFRLVEAADGRVLIDDVDISTLGLNDLRSKLSIIPQDPTLFDGTVRSNLDPLGVHSDADIWEALKKCQLAANVAQLPEKLDALVLSNGENWSQGQRQLFCLGRVLLKRSQILVLDEATASVDAETDSVMQLILRREFADSTVISIAHRIPTVVDSDKVLVLDAGMLQEYGAPRNLLGDSKSLFSSLVDEYSGRSSFTDTRRRPRLGD